MVLKRTWYPDKAFVIRAHDEALTELGSGGHPGFERGIDAFDSILAEAKRTRGTIHRKAAVFLKRLVDARIFLDGNHRVAFEVTDTFLRMNERRISTQNKQKIIRFIKDIKQYNVEQVEVWLEHGKMPQRPDTGSA